MKTRTITVLLGLTLALNLMGCNNTKEINPNTPIVAENTTESTTETQTVEGNNVVMKETTESPEQVLGTTYHLATTPCDEIDFMTGAWYGDTEKELVVFYDTRDINGYVYLDKTTDYQFVRLTDINVNTTETGLTCITLISNESSGRKESRYFVNNSTKESGEFIITNLDEETLIKSDEYVGYNDTPTVNVAQSEDYQVVAPTTEEDVFNIDDYFDTSHPANIEQATPPVTVVATNGGITKNDLTFSGTPNGSLTVENTATLSYSINNLLGTWTTGNGDGFFVGYNSADNSYYIGSVDDMSAYKIKKLVLKDTEVGHTAEMYYAYKGAGVTMSVVYGNGITDFLGNKYTRQ